jgi:hypothetical protein
MTDLNHLTEPGKKLGSLVRQVDIPVNAGLPSPREHRKWFGQQVVYKNYAGHSEDLDQKVSAFVYNHRERFYSRMGRVMERWETIWDAANGNPMWGQFEDDIHVPETKKMLAAKVARIEEALFEFDPIFEAEGTRGDLPQWKAQIITSYVYRQMEMANYRSFVQPLARDQEICNVAALKIRWDVQYGQVVERDWSLRTKPNGESYWHDERRIRDAVVREGVSYRMVDPFLFVYDLDCGDLDGPECAFVGDESDQFMHELEQMGKAGDFSEANLRKLRDRQAGSGMTNPQGPHTRAEWPDQRRASRSIAQGPTFSQDVKGEHDPRRVRCVEMWAWFDFGDGIDGVTDPLGRRVTGTHRVVITCANGVVLQFRLNPFDKKFHPYAIGRINRNGHESVAPPEFEQVIQMNAQYDRYQSNVQRHGDLSVAPFLAVNGEFPTDSLLGTRPGRVFSNVGQVQEIRVGDIPQSVSYFHQYYRREMEESSGAMRVFESPQGTATETERKVQEQQRMVRNSIRANADLWRMVALKTLWISAQFSTGPQRFAVVGKASQILGKSFEITPDIMQSEVDVRFLGLDSLHVFGNRVAGMAQWMNRWGPMMQALPEINPMALARQDFELTVGRHNIHDIFKSPEPEWSTWPQEQENEMLLSGHSVPISQRDDHMAHLESMEQILANLQDYPKYVQTRIRDHADAHIVAAMKQQQEQEQARRRAMMEQEAMGGVPGVDKPPQAGGMEAMAGRTGMVPGPARAETTSKPGRNGQGMSQTQAMS